jgi:GGDEF domain-containing protein
MDIDIEELVRPLNRLYEMKRSEPAGRLQAPDEYLTERYAATVHEHHITPVHAVKFAPMTKRDNLTGWFTNSDRKETVKRAQALVSNSNTKASYVAAAIDNLDGLNESLGNIVTDALFKQMAGIMLEHAQAMKNVDVFPFRLYASFFSFVIVGAAASEVRSIMERANCDVQRYVNAVGVQDLPHFNHIDDLSRYGSGIYFGVSDIDSESDIKDIIVNAEREHFANEKAGNRPNVNGETMPLVGDGIQE